MHPRTVIVVTLPAALSSDTRKLIGLVLSMSKTVDRWILHYLTLGSTPHIIY